MKLVNPRSLGLVAAIALAAFAAPTDAVAYATATRISPETQTATVGTPVSVDIRFTKSPFFNYSANGMQAWVNFDPTKLQAVSVAPAAGSPFQTVFITEIDNIAGKLTYAAKGANIFNANVAIATIVFNPIAGGTSPVTFSNVNQYINGTPEGVNGLAVGGSVTITAPVPTQTLTILGASGNIGDLAPNTEYFNPATGQWQPVYLTGGHPWGTVPGTNSWINYKPSNASDPDSSRDEKNPTWYRYRVRFNAPQVFANATMKFSLKADNFAKVAINNQSTGPMIVGEANGVDADAVFADSLVPGENTIAIDVGDWGGLNGFNFRIDLTVQSEQPLEEIPVETDTTAPQILTPANIVEEATSADGAVATFIATAIDNVDGRVDVSVSKASGTTFAIGTTTVNLSAVDAAGNPASSSFTVTVRDTTTPNLTVPANQSLEAAGPAGTVATYAASATDAVGVSSITHSPVSGSTFPIGTTEVLVTAKDAAGNTAGGAFSIAVADTIAPALTVPADQTLEATSASGAVATFAASATDAVGVKSLIYSTASGSTFQIGATSVLATAKDEAGNTSTGSFTVTVVDTTAPAIASVTPSTASLWSPNHKMVPISVSVSATDIVGIASLKIVKVTSSEPDNGLGDGDTANDTLITGALTVNLRAERGGKGNGRTYTIYVEAKDAAGNATISTCTVTVPKSQGK